MGLPGPRLSERFPVAPSRPCPIAILKSENKLYSDFYQRLASSERVDAPFLQVFGPRVPR